MMNFIFRKERSETALHHSSPSLKVLSLDIFHQNANPFSFGPHVVHNP